MLSREFFYKYKAHIVVQYHHHPATGRRGGHSIEIWSGHSIIGLTRALKEQGYELVTERKNTWDSTIATYHKTETK